MSAMLYNRRLLSTVAFAKRSFNSQAIIDLTDRMKSFNRSRQYRKTIVLFNQSKSHGNDSQNLLHSRSILFHVLKAHAELRDRELDSNLHQIISTKFKNDVYLLASLIHLHMQCNDVERAESVFNSSKNKSNGMYGSMMKGYIRSKQPEKAIRLFKQIRDPDEVIYTLFVNACAHIRSEDTLNRIQHVLKEIPQTLYSNPYFVTSLMNTLIEHGGFKSAQALFDSSTSKNIKMCTTLMKGYVVNNQPNQAIEIFRQIQNPDIISYITLYNACAQSGSNEALDLVKQTLKDLPQTCFSNSMFVTSLIDALSKCGDTDTAETFFNSSKNKTIQSYGAMMKGYILVNQPQRTVELFKEIKNPDTVIYILLFNACAQIGGSEQLVIIEDALKTVSAASYSNPIFVTSLLDAFGTCGDMESAEALFNSSTKKTIALQGALMKGYITNDQLDKAIDLFKNIKSPNVVIYTLLFNACAKIGSSGPLSLIKDALKLVPQAFYSNPIFVTSLIDAFCKCGDIESAEALFNSSAKKTIELQGALMKGYITNDQLDKAIDLFKNIKNPNVVIYTLLFNACAKVGSSGPLSLIKDVLKIVPREFYCNPIFVTSLLDAFCKCGDMESAETVFNSSNNKSIEWYRVMMKGYIVNEQAKKAIDLFKNMQDTDVVVYTLFYHACARLKSTEGLNLIKSTLTTLPKEFHCNPQCRTSLLDAFGKCGDIESAEALFNSSANKTVELQGALMKGYIVNDQLDKAIYLFKNIKNPNVVIYTLLFNACGKIGSIESLNMIKETLKKIPKEFYSNIQCLTSLVDALVKCGDIESAEVVFNLSTEKNIELQGLMMKAYIAHSQSSKAIDLFKNIKSPDIIIYTLLFNACAKIGSTESLSIIKETLKKLPKEFCSSVQCLTSLLDALIKCDDFPSAESLFSSLAVKEASVFLVMMNEYIKQDKPEKALELFDRMKKQGVERDLNIYVQFIRTFSKISHYSLSQSLIEQIPEDLLATTEIQAALIDMWGKTGYIEKAREIFTKTPQLTTDVYISMINAYAWNGKGSQALELYHQAPSESVNEITHICTINACSHSGLVNEARSIFASVKSKTARIFTTMVDCLARASHLGEAQDLINEFERANSPSWTMYMALLSGARNNKDSDLAEETFRRMKELFPRSKDVITSGSTLLANVYSSLGDLEKASDIRLQLQQSGLKKRVGVSWTVTDGQVHRFRAHDQSHPRSAEIYAEVEKMSSELVQHGHQYDSSWITRPLGADESVASVLCGHSERLAIAWNFVVNPHASQIQVTKNLRVCGDCHQATKLIAAIRRCDIIVRDANRIHHFSKNGQCSCNDYF